MTSLPRALPQRAALQIWCTLVEIAHRIGRAGAESLRSEDITLAQFALLQKLREEPDMNQQDLAERMHVTKGNISQILNTMERDGWIRREAGDGGNHLLMTARALGALERLEPLQADLMRNRFSCLSPRERDQLQELLEKVRSSIP
jgi:DNA-binding MarR family transcriptional regulator